ncbi:MAG: hypothetical protein HYV36_00345, partial [Lentisphaerae bacterium]|nr:hypothetical protein [Lentisphaerota bacterium]
PAQQELFARLAVLACDFLQQAADPDMALNNWERFVRALPDAAGHFQLLLSQPRRLEILMGIFSASQFLADTLIRNPEFLDWVTSSAVLHGLRPREVIEADLRAFVSTGAPADRLNGLRRFRRREILRIGTRDICLHAPIQEITGALADLAEACLRPALAWAWETIAGEDLPERRSWENNFCILAFGKLGGRELNYSSDVDLLGLCADALPGEFSSARGGEPLELFARVLKLLRQNLSTHLEEGHAYRVDFRLRPYGAAGHLVYTVSGLADYYVKKAASWEIQALLKARPVAGNEALGAAWLERIRPIFSRAQPSATIISSIKALRAFAVKDVAARDDVKSGLGGIRDIEFLVQGLQLIHVPRHSELLVGNTLAALHRLKTHKILPEEVVGQLQADYTFLRRVEHTLQIFEDRQIHELPKAAEARAALARRVLGLNATAAQFAAAVSACQQRVRETYAQYLLKAAV